MKNLFVFTGAILLFTVIGCRSDDDMIKPDDTGPEDPVDTLMACESSTLVLPDLDAWELEIVNPSVSGAIQILTSTNGLVISGVDVYETTDGFESLVELEGRIPEDPEVLEIISESEWIIAQHTVDSEGYFVSTILKTENSGLSWDTLTAENRDLLYVTRIHFISESKGFAVLSIPYLDSGYTNRKTVMTIDGGQSWVDIEELDHVQAGEAPYRPVIQFVDESIGYFLAQGELYKTVDGGFSFEPFDLDVDLIDFYVLDSDKIYGNSRSATFKSVDGGQTWQQIFDLPATVLKVEGNRALLLGHTSGVNCLGENMLPVVQPIWSFIEEVDGLCSVDPSEIRGYWLDAVRSLPDVTFCKLGSKVLTIRNQ